MAGYPAKDMKNPRRKRSDIRIVVIGDPGTGKSSLIASAANGDFPSGSGVLSPTHLYLDHFPLTIIDSSSRMENRAKLIEELQRADVIVATYACDEPATFNHLVTFWLRHIRQLEVAAPVFVVGCKLDLVDVEDRHLEQLVSPVMIQFREIETCIECSAAKRVNVEDVFYYAQKAVLYPIGPVFNRERRSLMPRCQRALKRIFMIADYNVDGALDDSELNSFQVKCFDAPLHPAEIAGVKRLVRDKLPDGVNNHGLTLKGFLFLHSLFVEKGRVETTWNVLRTFGYDDDIRLRDDFLSMSFKRAPDQSVELTRDALDFLGRVFSVYDAQREGTLLLSDLDEVFSTAPESPWNEAPYKDAVEKSSKGMSVKGFISEWALMTLLDPTYSLANMVYIGYSGDPASAFTITRKRSIDFQKMETRKSVFQCFVFGPKDSGKSSLLDSFLGRGFLEESSSTLEDRYAVNFVGPEEGIEKTLVLREIPEGKFTSFLANKDSLAGCDVAIFVHDSSNETCWMEASKMLMEVARQGEVSGYGMPCLVVGTKNDLEPHQFAMRESIKVCEEMGMQSPISVSAKKGEMDDVFSRIISAAQCPHVGVPQTETRRRRNKYTSFIHHSLIFLALGAAASAVGMTAYRGYTARKHTRLQSGVHG